MSQPVRAAEAVSGDVISRSKVKTLGGLLFMGLMSLVCVLIVIAWFTGFAMPLPAGAVRVNGAGAAIAGIGAVIMPLGVLGLGWMLFVDERLILGDDRLQIVRRLSGQDQVTTQVPYRNIAALESVNDEGVRFVGINVQDPSDPDTFETDSDLPRAQQKHGWNIRIHGGYQESTATIHEMLSRKIARGPR